jgi:hypothetical protein
MKDTVAIQIVDKLKQIYAEMKEIKLCLMQITASQNVKK